MWLLTNDGEILEGKRIWLKPDSQHLFGRTSQGSSGYAIDNKSVSRKHLTIRVAADEDGVLDPFVTSKVIIEDLNTKYGTTVDGEVVTKAEKTLGGKVMGNKSHTIKIGKYEKLFHLQKSSTNPIELYRPRLEPLDIKISIDYIPNKTTHVIARKRNTPKGLQALVSAEHIVTDAFLEALESVATRPEAGDEVIFSPLEQDFDAHWPNEIDYLPGPGSEPMPRSADFFKPEATRSAVFSGYTFVFCDQAQFDTLQPAITQGGGKALIYDLKPGSTSPGDLASYVRRVAGDKGNGEFEDGSEGKGVVVVRTARVGASFEQWIVQFFPQVDVQLGQRSIEQNEFLDAILINDASVLRRALEEDAFGSSLPPRAETQKTQPQTTKAAIQVVSQETATPEPDRNTPVKEEPPRTEPRKRRGLSRAITTSRFKGFDDFDSFDIPKIQPVHENEDEDMEEAVSPRPSQPVSVSGASQMPAPSRASQTQTTRTSSKRPRTEAVQDSEEEDANDAVDRLLPAATAMKRRRLEQQLRESGSKETSAPVDGAAIPSPRKRALELPSDLRKQKKEKEINIVEVAKERRAKEEEARRLDEESLREALDGMDIEKMRDLAQVEEMEIKPRTAGQTSRLDGENEDDPGWREEWNGRRNFKKFRKRRPGDNANGAPEPIRGRKVIVPLEEVPREDYGGTPDDYFLENHPNRLGTPSQSQSQSQNQNQARSQKSARKQLADEDEDEDAPAFRRTRGRRLASVAPDAATVEVAASEGEGEGEGEAPNDDDDGFGFSDHDDASDTRSRSRSTQKSTQKVTQTQRQNASAASKASSTGKGRGKREVPQPAVEPPAKRSTRAVAARGESDDESDDELKFRFKRRR